MSIETSYDPALVVLSVLIATLASYTALDLAARVRSAAVRVSWTWIAAASVALGGGIWSMHFIAMLAFRMPMPVAYDATLTLVSLLLAVAVTAAGFFVVGRRTARTSHVAVSGFFMGIGIAGMHYTGMAAMRMAAVQQYNVALVATSVAIAIAAASVALWLTLRQQNMLQKLVAAVAMGIAISGMHYTGMAAASFTDIAGAAHPRAHTAFRPDNLALAIGGTSALILCLALIAAFIDRRFSQLAEREAMVLRQSERRFRLLVQGVTDYAIYMLDPQGHVANWNPGAERSKGYGAWEIFGQHCSRFYTEEDIAAGEPEKALDTALRVGRHETERWCVRKDGSRFWASTIIDPIREDDGTHIGFGVVTRDMTERREAEMALKQANEQLFQAQKMEAIGQLTGGVAHDFNNLLTILMGNLELAQRALEGGSPIGALVNVERAMRSASRAATLTNRLLSFARRQALQPQPIDPNALIGTMTELIRRTIGETIDVQSVLAGGLWQIRADPNQLEGSLLNLVINARDAMPNGGKVTIETSNSHLDEAYAASRDEVDPGQYVQIAVTDTGTGMTTDVVARAFEPFYTTKGVGEGSGLGLSQVFGFVKQSGGHVAIYSEPGRGTTVRIYLPRCMDAAPLSPDHREPRTALPLPKGRETVLLVEDEAAVREYSYDVLTQLGYHVIEAQDAPSALAALDSNPDIALLFTDVVLPGMNGRELAGEAVRRRPELRVLYTTGYTSSAIVHNGILDADATLLVKPFNMSALASIVRKSLGSAARAGDLTERVPGDR
jgi:PAS domain S-box-containing protein